MARKPKSRAARRRRPHNRGLDRHRLGKGGDKLEQAFADLWEAVNEPHPGMNYGHGTLQDLIFRSDGAFRVRLPFWVTQRERIIVATVIQWLGTNCGFAFLCGALGKVDLTIKDVRRQKGREKKVDTIRCIRFGRRFKRRLP